MKQIVAQQMFPKTQIWFKNFEILYKFVSIWLVFNSSLLLVCELVLGLILFFIKESTVQIKKQNGTCWESTIFDNCDQTKIIVEYFFILHCNILKGKEIWGPKPDELTWNAPYTKYGVHYFPKWLYVYWRTPLNHY